ncbi:MAG: hypothetical protein ACP5FX_03355, partial [Candidatus Micrarchaeia archaeon]
INLCREKEQEITSNVYVVLLQFKEMFQFRPPISKIVDKISFLEKERIKKELNNAEVIQKHYYEMALKKKGKNFEIRN